MPAYVIAETDVHDPEQYERYKAASPCHRRGWRPLPRPRRRTRRPRGGLATEAASVLEFDDLQAARRWFDSSEYRQARRLRKGAASLRIVAVEGL